MTQATGFSNEEATGALMRGKDETALIHFIQISGALMIILRLARGISEHFPQRFSEWVSTGAILALSYVLGGDDKTFDAPAFSEIAKMASEETWSVICLYVGIIRLFALVVNGTFRKFPYSPHLRSGATVITCIFWGELTLGMYLAWMNGAPGVGVVLAGALMAQDCWNLFRAWADISASRQNKPGAKYVRPSS